jgi:hypothetical protein
MGLEGLSDEPKNLDLSAKTFEEFVEFFFARRVVPDKEQWDYFKTDLELDRTTTKRLGRRPARSSHTLPNYFRASPSFRRSIR